MICIYTMYLQILPYPLPRSAMLTAALCTLLENRGLIERTEGHGKTFSLSDKNLIKLGN